MNLATTIEYEKKFLNLWFIENKSSQHPIDIFDRRIYPGSIAVMNRAQYAEFKNYLIMIPYAFGRLAVGGPYVFKNHRGTAFRLHELPSNVRHDIQQEDPDIRDDQYISFVEESI